MIDWQTICNNIRLAGVPLERASRELGKGSEYLQNVKRKAQNPRFEDGCKLLRYHLRLCGKDAHKRVVTVGRINYEGRLNETQDTLY